MSGTQDYSTVDVEMVPVDNVTSPATTTPGSSDRQKNQTHHADIITSRQPTFPSEYASREGNASMLAILGFVMATLTASLLDIFAPHAAHQPIWLFLMSFGGLLQVYAGFKDFCHGNTLTACIFLLFGFHWISHGFLEGDLLFLQNVGPTANQVSDQSVMGCYYISFTLFELMLTVTTYLNPHGSWLLVAILVVVQIKLILLTINAWTPHEQIKQTQGVFGVIACLLAFYSFFAESLAEHGDIIPTGKFLGTKSRSDVKEEMNARAHAKKNH